MRIRSCPLISAIKETKERVALFGRVDTEQRKHLAPVAKGLKLQADNFIHPLNYYTRILVDSSDNYQIITILSEFPIDC